MACNSTSRRDGRPLEELGFYNPRTKETRLDTEAIRARLGQGAQPTDVVRTLLERGGLIEKTIRSAETVGKAKQAAKREAEAKKAAKEAAEAKAAAEAEAAAASSEGESSEGDPPKAELSGDRQRRAQPFHSGSAGFRQPCSGGRRNQPCTGWKL